MDLVICQSTFEWLSVSLVDDRVTGIEHRHPVEPEITVLAEDVYGADVDRLFICPLCEYRTQTGGVHRKYS